MAQSSQIKSRESVAAHGEVFTAEREVRAMCDLVADECNRMDSRFPESACGDGDFLNEQEQIPPGIDDTGCDQDTREFIPLPIREYSPIDYWRLGEHGQ